MIIYNTTFHIAQETLNDCLLFLKNTYIPQASASGFLMHPRLYRVMLDNTNEGESYSLQFKVKNVDTLNYWMAQEGAALHATLVSRFGVHVTGFSTLLEEIDLEND